ncbi:CNNM domain-containing protein [Novipirellula sp. SH528]|uniref:CNNM domain-containing protein n=1 Tax=Novipirellula sp. SH528 TaxID=3454466 RepID=UPI003FA07C2B
MIITLIIFVIGLMLSAFFSGSETGLYRVSRTRLVLDGLSGSRMARGVVWLLNHPAIFVATMLVGNNIANYLVSLAIVMAALILFGDSASAEIIGPVLMTPVVFVLGELLPKYLFFHAPYRLLRATRPALLFATLLFAPITILLGLLGNALRLITGETPFRVRLAMARGELDQVLRDGHEAGILAAGQRVLAQNLFEVGNQPAVSYGVTPQRLAIVQAPVNVLDAKHQARRRNHPIVLVQRGGRIIGFLRYADLCVANPRVDIKPVIRGRTTDRHLRILLRLYDAASDVAVLFDDHGDMRSVVTRRQLLQPLIK